MNDKRSIFSEFKQQIQILLTVVAILWAIEIADWLIFRGVLDQWFGIRPHRLSGLWGILFAPFLHGDFTHLLANTVPLVSLGWLIMLRLSEDWFVVSGIVCFL